MSCSWQHWVFLSDDQVERGTNVGKARMEDVVLHQRKHTNNRKDNYPKDLHDHIIAARSELAGKIFLGPATRWHELHGRGKPDLDNFIDVKAVETKSKRLIVAITDLRPDRAYLSVYCETQWYWIRGWRWGHEMKQIIDPRGDRPFYVINSLRDPETLIREARNART